MFLQIKPNDWINSIGSFESTLGKKSLKASNQSKALSEIAQEATNILKTIGYAALFVGIVYLFYVHPYITSFSIVLILTLAYTVVLVSVTKFRVKTDELVAYLRELETAGIDDEQSIRDAMRGDKEFTELLAIIESIPSVFKRFFFINRLLVSLNALSMQTGRLLYPQANPEVVFTKEELFFMEANYPCWINDDDDEEDIKYLLNQHKNAEG